WLSRTAFITRKYFDTIPAKEGHEILIRLYKEEKVTWGLLGLLVNFFDIIDKDLRNELLLIVANDKKNNKVTEFVISKHSGKIPEEVMNKLPQNFKIKEEN